MAKEKAGFERERKAAAAKAAAELRAVDDARSKALEASKRSKEEVPQPC